MGPPETVAMCCKFAFPPCFRLFFSDSPTRPSTWILTHHILTFFTSYPSFCGYHNLIISHIIIAMPQHKHSSVFLGNIPPPSSCCITIYIGIVNVYHIIIFFLAFLLILVLLHFPIWGLSCLPSNFAICRVVVQFEGCPVDVVAFLSLLHVQNWIFIF